MTDKLPVKPHCVGCPTRTEALKQYKQRGFDTPQNLARFVVNFCEHPATPDEPLAGESLIEAHYRSMCHFGKLLLKADAIERVKTQLGTSEHEAEEFLGYSGAEL